jgi:hypothetical protein
MIKNFNIPITKRIQIFQVWLASLNWTLGVNQLTEAELEIFSYLLYYNDQYKSIQDHNLRMDLLFSTTIKKKIKDEFNIPTAKFETYLNKLRKKGVLEKNSIVPRFIIYPEDKLQVSFTCGLTATVQRPVVVPESPKVEEPIVQEEVREEFIGEYNDEPYEEPIDELDEPDSDDIEHHDFRDPFDKYFNNNGQPPMESWM